MTIATGILVMVALTVVGTLVAAVVYAVLTRGRDWWRELWSVRVLPFVFAGLAAGLTTLGIGLAAKGTADESLRLAVDDIETDCDDLLTLLLHVDATYFADCIATTNPVTRETLQQLADECLLDEFTLVDKKGNIAETNDPGARSGDDFFTDERLHGPYRALLDGRRRTVRQRFRPSATCAERVMKYFGIPLPQGGFIQIGFRWEGFEREFERFFLPIFETRTVSETGICVILDERDTVAVNAPGHPDMKGLTAAEVGFTPADLAVPLGQVFRATVFGTRCRCMAYPERIGNYRIIAAVPLAERQGRVMALAAGVMFVLFAAFLVFRLVLRSFRRAQAKIDALRAEEERRRTEDMKLARDIQRAELRTDGTEGNGYRLSSLMNAAREVGGDFYDYYELPDGRLAVTVADVSGKGVPAAFFMMKSRVTLKSCVYSSATLAEAVATANARLSANNPADMFVTAWTGVYDRKTGALEFVSAGHNPPIVRRRDGTVEWLQAPRAAAMGAFGGVRYRGSQTTLGAGDRLFLYTDGVNEAMNAAGELFGNDRLFAAVKMSAGALVPAVRAAVDAFVASAEQADDITMLELEVT